MIIIIQVFVFYLGRQGTLRAGKLTEKILKRFVATGKDEILSLINDLNIQLVLVPVLPTSKSVHKLMLHANCISCL